MYIYILYICMYIYIYIYIYIYEKYLITRLLEDRELKTPDKRVVLYFKYNLPLFNLRQPHVIIPSNV